MEATRTRTSRVDLDVDLAGEEEDYCTRIENNLIARNDRGVGLFYLRNGDTRGRFEIVNNTIADNDLGFEFGADVPGFAFVNNVIFGNTQDFNRTSIEFEDYDFRGDSIDTGRLSGENGNFSADPLFVGRAAGDYRLGTGSPAAGRGVPREAPLEDLGGARRGRRPALGAYERSERSGERLSGLACGDGVVQRGSVETAAGPSRDSKLATTATCKTAMVAPPSVIGSPRTLPPAGSRATAATSVRYAATEH